MWEYLLKGWSLGIATGVVCLSTCAFIYAPYIGNEKRSLLSSLGVIFKISAGRFVAYFAFGLMAGYLGGNIDSHSRELFTSISYLVLSAILILNLVRINKIKTCGVKQANKWINISKYPVLLGVATGINFCPSFLIALSNSVELGGALQGGMFFIAFFFGTSIFLLPLAFAGLFSQIKKFNLISKYATIGVAVWFSVQGVMQLKHHFLDHGNEMSSIDTTKFDIANFLDEKPLTIVHHGKGEKELYLKLLKKLNKVKTGEVKFIEVSKAKLSGIDEGYVIESNMTSKKVMDQLKDKPYYKVVLSEEKCFCELTDAEKETYVNRLVSFLGSYHFQADKENGFMFRYAPSAKVTNTETNCAKSTL